MIWVRRAIWVVLVIFAVTVLVVVFSGGLVRDRPEGPPVQSDDPRESVDPPSGSMAYDRFLPGGRQDAQPR